MGELFFHEFKLKGGILKTRPGNNKLVVKKF
jgi:hypothetical protein